jgi:CubicO group peptidase (beta-lactamase class C family)/D-alanyl-D-alanine dipeptidase
MNRAAVPFSLVAAALLLGPPARAAAQATVAPAERYAAAVEALDRFIAREVADKDLPALSVALVDDQTIVWAKGYGFADPKAKTPATADTVYRVGSVSKLFTDIAVMQLVERGVLDLDAPVTRYLPDFRPHNPFDKPITLRQLMAHRSGLVREPPVGNYFDPAPRTLAETVQSLNRTTLVYPPESLIKYSNAAIATVGYVLEATQKEPFPRYLRRAVLEPLGLKKSGFEATPALTRDLANAVMWAMHGRTFEAPTFPLGMAPAGSMYSTVQDLGRFLSVLFVGGKGPGGPVLKPATLEAMFRPQFAPPSDKTGFGIGFHLGELDGHRRLGHGGAIYGFATDLSALPDDKLGVVVVISKDVTNAVATRIADVALKHLLAVRQGKPLPAIETTTPLPPERMRPVAGRYRNGDRVLELRESFGKLWLSPLGSLYRVQVRGRGGDLVTDDALHHGLRVSVEANGIRLGKTAFERVTDCQPEPPPDRWLGLIGEYGWDHNTLYVFEREGKLHALVEWYELNPLEEESENVFKLPAGGCMYHGEKVIFTRDAAGRATQAEFASVVFPRRALDGENGATFRIRPLRPVEELRKEALASTPPREELAFRKPDLVELTALEPTLKLDVRYATANNFLSTPVYTQARAFLQRPAAEALVRVHRKLAEKGYGLLIHDGYRPWYVTKIFWEATPPRNRIFVANPAGGSRHNRGMAADLTLFDRQTGKPIDMVGGYDEMSDRSYPDYPGGTSRQRWHRDLLRRAMEAEGFTVYEAEWWHFDFQDWKKYPLGNLRFEEILRQQGEPGGQGRERGQGKPR